MRLTGLIIVAAVCLTAPAAAPAAILVQSTFDGGDDGWRVGEFFNTAGAGVPTYAAAGGNPGGFVRTGDVFGWNAYHAPAAFLGDQSAAYGGNLHVEQRVLGSDGVNYPMVVISDGVLSLQFRTAPPGAGWTVYDIPLLASAGWEVANGSGDPGPAASEAQLQQVLGSLTFLHLDADWFSGSDQVDLDNVRLESFGPAAVPEPASVALLTAGGLGLLARRLRRS